MESISTNFRVTIFMLHRPSSIRNGASIEIRRKWRNGERMSPSGGFAQSRSAELHLEELAQTWPRFLARRSNAYNGNCTRNKDGR